jgi:hypothetical protein
MTTGIRLIALTLAALLFVGCAVDKPCTVTTENAPELRGFRLGMGLSDIQKRFPSFPSSRISANQMGLAIVEMSTAHQNNALGSPEGQNFISLYYRGDYPELNDLEDIELKLLDGHLIEITVYYPNDIKWKSADEFAQKTSEALKLDGSWRQLGKDDDYSEARSMICGEAKAFFVVNAGFHKPPTSSMSAGKLPYVELEDLMRVMEIGRREEEIKKNKQQEEERRKQTFRP